MSKLTDILGLFQYDPETDGANTFNITQALNNNWDKIDAWASGIKSTIVGLVPGTRKVNGKALSEDLTLTGEDIKVSGSDETSISSSLSNKAASSLSQITESDLLAWAEKQTLSGAFGVSPSITTEGVPVVGWYHGFLEVKNDGRRITLTESAGQYRTWTNCTSSGKWTKWMQQATATPPQEVPLPLVSGVSELNVATVSKTQEGIILVNAWVGFDRPVIANTETQVAIMPENMRPKKTVGVSAIVNSGDDENLGFARISIDSGGVVRILSDISFSFAVFSIAYPAAN